MNERHPRSPFQAIRPIDYTIIFVRDMAAMRRFYEDILCFPPSRELSPGALTLDKSVTRYNEFDISNKVREKGWILSAYSMPPDAQEVNSLRIVVRPHINRDVSEILANDIEQACEYLEQHGGTATPPKLHDPHKTSAKC